MSSQEVIQVKELAKLLLSMKPEAPLALKQGVVSAVTGGGTLEAFLSGDSLALGGIHHFASYLPRVGDVVWFLKNGPDLICLGNLSLGEDHLPYIIETSENLTVTNAMRGYEIIVTGSTQRIITLPTNASSPMPVGSQIKVLAGGTGGFIIAGAGLTLLSKNPGGTLRVSKPGGYATATKVATDTWTISGDLDAPYFSGYSSGKTLNGGAWTFMGIDSESYDDWSLHSTVVNTHRVTLPASYATGVWHVTASAQFAAAQAIYKMRIHISTGWSETKVDMFDGSAYHVATDNFSTAITVLGGQYFWVELFNAGGAVAGGIWSLEAKFDRLVTEV